MDTAPPVPATLTVQLFARYAELFGAERLTLRAEGIGTVGDVLDRLRQLPGGDSLGAAALVAVNLRQADRGAPVSAGDEIALLPPLAGG
jgi:molybdopterin converting factor small subunit